MNSGKEYLRETSAMGNTPVHTYHGRGLTQDINSPPVSGVGGNFQTRTRRNSIRRLKTSHLVHLAKTTENDALRNAASREIGVREDMMKISKEQAKQGTIRATGGASLKLVEGMRFTQSMFDETKDRLQEQFGKKSIGSVLGIAEGKQGIRIGMSGSESESGQDKRTRVAQEVLKTQSTYQGSDKEQWSGQLYPVMTNVPNVMPDSNTELRKVCAANRASTVSLTSSQFMQETIERQQVPTSEGLLETDVKYMLDKTPLGGLQKHSEVEMAQQLGGPLPEQDTQQVSTRARSLSTRVLLKSCDQCQKERQSGTGK